MTKALRRSTASSAMSLGAGLQTPVPQTTLIWIMFDHFSLPMAFLKPFSVEKQPKRRRF